MEDSKVKSLVDYKLKAISGTLQPAVDVSSPPVPPKTKLLEQVRQAIHTRHYSPKTKEIGYINGVVRAKRPHRLPVVLTRQEVKSILGILDHSDWLMAVLLYGAGLRLMECLQLRVKDIDFTSNQISFAPARGIKTGTRCFPGR